MDSEPITIESIIRDWKEIDARLWVVHLNNMKEFIKYGTYFLESEKIPEPN